MKKKILLISPDFDYSNGVTRHLLILFHLLLGLKNFDLHFITNRGDALSELKNFSNLKYTVYPFSNSKLSISIHFRFFRFLRNYCLTNNINIIHTHHRYPEFISYLISRSIDIKTVTTAHSLVKKLRLISFKSDLIIAVSAAVKNYLVKNFNVNESKIFILYNCISEKAYYECTDSRETLRKIFNIEQSDFVFLYAGRINKIKGIDLLVSAFCKLLLKYQNSKLLLVGNVEDSSLLKEFHKNILVIPSQKQIQDYFLLTDFCVLPSREEPLGFFMLESALFERPFIGARVDGIAEFIEDTFDGLLFNPNDDNDLLNKMLFSIEYNKKVKIMSIRLKQKVFEKCGCEKYLNNITNLYSRPIE